MESPLVVALRAAIQEARARYERGAISVEQLERALDAITSAPDVNSVAAMMAELPSAPHPALAALEVPPTLPVETPGSAGTQRGAARISAIMGATRRTRKPWTLAPQSRVTAVMGEMRLDLRQARLPPHAMMRVTCVMGDTRILIPEGVRVSVRTRAIMSGGAILGEYLGGIAGGGEEWHEPATGAPVAELEIEASVIMGTLKIQVVGPASAASISLGELAQDLLREALTSARASLKARSARRAAINPGADE